MLLYILSHHFAWFYTPPMSLHLMYCTISCYLMSFHIISSCSMSLDISSHYLMSLPIVSCHFTLNHVTSHYIVLFHIISFHFTLSLLLNIISWCFPSSLDSSYCFFLLHYNTRSFTLSSIASHNLSFASHYPILLHNISHLFI